MKKFWAYIVTGFLMMQMLSLCIAPISGKEIPVADQEDLGEYVPDELIIKFKKATTAAAINSLNTVYRLSLISKGINADFHRLKISNGKTPVEMMQILQKHPLVEYAEPNYIARIAMTPNDPYFSYQWHLLGVNDGGINIQPAWDIATGTGVTVAVIDTGISTNGNDLVNTCFVPGYDFVNNDNNPTDDNGHGTHVAGTVAQSTNNAVGACGVAFNACLMPVKVLNSQGTGTYADIVDGINFATTNGAHIISISIEGNVPSSALEAALANAYNNGVTVVAASGNSGQNGVAYPAAYDAYVIAVGATRYDKTRSYYSNYGTSLDVVAPGGDVYVDQNGDGYADGVLQETFDPTWGYYFWQGTSMATPHVSGVAALLYSEGVTSPDSIRTAIQNTAIDLGSTGWDIHFGHGLIDAYNALTYNTSNTAPDVPSSPNPVDGAIDISLSPTISAYVNDADGDTMTVSFYEQGDTLIGTDTIVGSGTASVAWTGANQYATTYSWYVTADDGTDATTSPTWSFTTISAPNTPPDPPGNPTPVDGTLNVSVNPTLTVDVTDPEGHTMDISFYDELGGIIGTDNGVASGGTASVVWSGRTYATTYGWYAIADDNYGGSTTSATWYFTTIDEPATQNFYPDADITVQNGGMTGSYIDTHASDNVYEGITEKKTGPKSQLEHRWTINVVGGKTSYTFKVEAYHTINSEGDEFIFAYSLDGNTYIPMVTVSKTSDDNTLQSYALPNSLSGMVYIQVKDADQTKGNNGLDTIFIDQMFIEGGGQSQPNNAPDIPSNPNPVDGATDVSLSPTLFAYVNDVDGNTMTVRFYEQGGTLIGTDTVAGSGTASIVWTDANQYATTYSWYVTADDGTDATTSPTWSFTTTIGGGLSVTSITPDTVPSPTVVDVTITGTGFQTGAEVSFEGGSGPAPTTSNIVVVDASTITVTVTVKDGGPPKTRYWDVHVANPDSSTAVLADGFIVQP